jgi:hypothetical protein
MSLLIYSGLLYLVGIAIVLAFKPVLMFSKDGNWKEFGIGRSKERYTWMPFWLFAILWAILSYTIVLVIVSNTQSVHTPNNFNEVNEMNEMNDFNEFNGKNKGNRSKTNRNNTIDYEEPNVGSLKKGYYILNTNASKNGSPKYIYLGPQAPNLHYEDE